MSRLTELQYFQIECSDKHLTESREQLKQLSLVRSSLKSQFKDIINLKIMFTSLNHIKSLRKSTLLYDLERRLSQF